MQVLKPERLHIDDTVAIVSPSWGGPSVFPHIYELGLGLLQRWGLNVVEYPTARMPAAELSARPDLRADDINRAFADPQVKAIIAAIGGDDSHRILPFLDAAVIKANPKILMGYSDTSTLHLFCQRLGLVTLHGPSIMAGFAQMSALPDYAAHVKEMLFLPEAGYRYQPFAAYCDGYPDWRQQAKAGQVNDPNPAEGWRLLQGAGAVEGRLFGGCIDVFEGLRGGMFWPPTGAERDDFWDGRLLFLETSEEAPGPELVADMLRGWGRDGILARIAGLMVGRPARYDADAKLALDEAIVGVVAGEFGRPELPIMTNMDFGHTDPQFVLPQGIRARLDCDAKTLDLAEAWLG
ncbi:S66 family peptidase [Dongia rigui]|uniref:LD-carboxypeptidase n=1 Tax=Dongia rigui TaxID=940149 RepID=A0ABU5DVS8_9PROT|nr:S66 peptidase family protein [Dongia rigui]MDY0870813.1 LD-carboxypeptidase [Dongia rigui]